MNWWNQIAESREPDLLIGDPKSPYLRRWYMVPRNENANVYLHEFLRDDDDRALHDHPWESFSTLLEGSLLEIDADNPEGKTIMPGDIRNRSANYAHRLIVLKRGFSLFCTGPKIREWGFHCPQGFVPWTEFVNMDNPGEVGRGCGES